MEGSGDTEGGTYEGMKYLLDAPDSSGDLSRLGEGDGAMTGEPSTSATFSGSPRMGSRILSGRLMKHVKIRRPIG